MNVYIIQIYGQQVQVLEDKKLYFIHFNILHNWMDSPWVDTPIPAEI